MKNPLSNFFYCLLIPFGCVSFIMWDTNPMFWGVWGRALFIVVFLILWISTPIEVYNDENKESSEPDDSTK